MLDWVIQCLLAPRYLYNIKQKLYQVNPISIERGQFRCAKIMDNFSCIFAAI